MSSTGPSDTTVRRLFAVSMNCCAFPGCTTAIIDPTANTVLAEVCHIRARSQHGPRYDAGQSDVERHGFDNLVLMCGVHHKLIDAPENLGRFTTEALCAIKMQHEAKARSVDAPTIQLTEALLSALQASASTYESGSSHNDFRHAVFQIGGEGGQWGGGGGGGGLLTIVGTARIPAEVSFAVPKSAGPGGGGGGGGDVQFVGRPVDNADLAGGFRLCSLFLANSVSFSGPLINLLGGGWSYYPIQSAPTRVKIWLVLTADVGNAEPATLLRLTIRVIDPSGCNESERHIDIEVPDCPDLVKRVSRAQLLEIELTAAGIWKVVVSSSTHQLGEHFFECRIK